LLCRVVPQIRFICMVQGRTCLFLQNRCQMVIPTNLGGGISTAHTAERLARYFGGDAISWLTLQAMYDVKTLSTREEIRNRVQPRTDKSFLTTG
jgi:hypothetical protein